jgi:tubulin---tyrosine ligase
VPRYVLPIRSKTNPAEIVQAIIDYEDPYVQPLVQAAFKSVLPEDRFRLVPNMSDNEGGLSLSTLLKSPRDKVLQITAYESIDFEFAADHAQSCLVNSYMIRKALIRKHYLSTTVDHWVAKNPASVLKTHMKRSEAFELDYAEFLDDALVEAFDLRESMDRNEQLTEGPDSKLEELQWWILKPGMSDRGQGIRLFSLLEELQDIFDGWEEDRPDSDDDDDDDDDDDKAAAEANKSGDYLNTSHLRHFVAQPYIHPPLLVKGNPNKFHIRTYVLCVGGLKVYVYKHMLALFAAKPYTAPWEAPDDIESFLTNTCLQDSPNDNAVQRFWDLALPESSRSAVCKQICAVTGEVFEAAARAMPIHFQAMPNAFEVYGLDFIVDAAGEAWLLEVNAFPDFKQTGDELQEIVAGFWRGVMRRGVAPFFGVEEEALGARGQEEEDMVLVRDVDLGRN